MIMLIIIITIIIIIFTFITLITIILLTRVSPEFEDDLLGFLTSLADAFLAKKKARPGASSRALELGGFGGLGLGV